VVPGNAYTEEGRRKVADLYSQLASIESAHAKETVVGTRYHPKDIYNDMISMNEDVVNDVGEVEEERPVYEILERVVEEDGDFLWPRSQRSDGAWFGFNQEVLQRKKAKYLDQTQYFAQYYNNPNDPTSQRIGVDKFQYYEKRMLLNEGGYWFVRDRRLNTFAAMDFAFSLANRADYTAIVVIGVDFEHNYYVLDIARFKSDKISVYFDHILAMHSKWGFRKLRAEVTAAQQVIVREIKENYIKPYGLVLAVDEYRPSRHEGAKEERMAATLEPRYDNHQMWHYKGGNCSLLEEELIMARPPHDDIKDALTAAIDVSVAPQRYRERTRPDNNVIYHARFGGVRA